MENKKYKLKELISNTYMIVSKDVIEFLNIHNTKRIGDTKIYLINSCQYEIVNVVEEIKENKMSHSERRLKGYKNKRMNFLENNHEFWVTNNTGYDIIIEWKKKEIKF